MCENQHAETVRRSRTEQDTSRRVSLTLRDRELLVEVFLQRALTRKQCQRLGFFDSTAVANSRLRRLFDAGYLRRAFVPCGAYATEAVYVLGATAIPLIVATIGIAKEEVRRIVGQDAPLFLAHVLLVTDLRILVIERLAVAGLSGQWLSEPELRHAYAVGKDHHVFKPDGAVLIGEASDIRLVFFEADRGNCSSPQFAKCAGSYGRYLTLGLSRELYGTENVEVICVTTGGSRRVTGLRRASESGGYPMRIVTLAEFSKDPLDYLTKGGHQ